MQESIFKDLIVINVLDPTNIKKDEQLSFSRSLLQKHMKYFEKSMEQKQLLTIEHNSAIFEWLLRYILQIEDWQQKQPNAHFKVDKNNNMKGF